MSEILKVYNLNDPDTAIPMDRDKFYKEQLAIYKKTGKNTMAADVVSVLIFNNSDELIIQKRSHKKAHNAGLLDKSIGGHVRFGDSADYTVMVETVQELQTPSIVLKNTDDFKKTRVLLHDYLTTINIIKHSHSRIQTWNRTVDNKVVKMTNKVHAYFGIYDGRIKPVDREAKGILYYSMEELEKEMKEFPETFTNDLHVLIKDLKPEIKDFLKLNAEQRAKEKKS